MTEPDPKSGEIAVMMLFLVWLLFVCLAVLYTLNHGVRLG